MAGVSGSSRPVIGTRTPTLRATGNDDTSAEVSGEFTINVGAPAVAGCAGTGDGDFNGDGRRDVTIADPFATVGSLARAGAVYLSYGGSGAVEVLDENLTDVPETAQANARFGHAIEVYDANDDGCSDLAIGLPFKPAARSPMPVWFTCFTARRPDSAKDRRRWSIRLGKPGRAGCIHQGTAGVGNAVGSAVPARSCNPGSGGIPATAVSFGTEVR